MTSEQIKSTVCEVLNEKKAEDITVLAVGHLTIIADYFVIATARNISQAKALSENVDEKLSKIYGLEPLRIEGVREGRWIVMDYGGVIVHIFNDDTRMLYCLDKLWSDGSNVEKYDGAK